MICCWNKPRLKGLATRESPLERGGSFLMCACLRACAVSCDRVRSPLRKLMSESPKHFDAIIVGARVAGSAAAILLARDGRSVLLVDKDGFPSDRLSTHIVLAGGTKVLERMGALEMLERAGGVRFERMRTVGPYFEDVSRKNLGDELVAEFESAPGAGNLVCRCENGLTVAATAFDASAMQTFRTDLASNLRGYLNRSFAVGKILESATMVGKVFSSGLLNNTYLDPV